MNTIISMDGTRWYQNCIDHFLGSGGNLPFHRHTKRTAYYGLINILIASVPNVSCNFCSLKDWVKSYFCVSVFPFWTFQVWAALSIQNHKTSLKLFNDFTTQNIFYISSNYEFCASLLNASSVTRKKSPNVYKSCPKTISLEKL